MRGGEAVAGHQEGKASPEDAEFLGAFEDGSLAAAAFRHRDHIRMAWLYVRRDGDQRGLEEALEGIRRFAERHGATRLYHETLSRVWVRLVSAALACCPETATFDEFVAAHPELLDKRRPYAFYAASTLDGDAARAAWVEPDLGPLPVSDVAET